MSKVPFLSLKETYLELKSEMDAAFAQVMERGHYILGPEVQAFESEFATYCGSRHAIGVSNGLDALVLILKALEIGPGDEVLVPSNTFIATWLAVSQVGAIPVPVDPIPATQNIDPKLVADAITAKTKAVMPVHLYGCPADMDPILSLARSAGLHVIEDAAQAQGASYKQKRAGALGAAAGFSFYPGKNLGAFGDAGAITTSDDDLARKVKQLRNYGSEKKYVHQVMGYNNRLDELQAAFLRIKLRKLDAWNARRTEIAQRYLSELKGLPLDLPVYGTDFKSSWHLFVIRTDARDQLQSFLDKRGIGTLVHYPIPPLEQEAYRDLKPRARSEFKEQGRLLSLPIWPHMSDEMVDAVCSSTREFFG